MKRLSLIPLALTLLASCTKSAAPQAPDGNASDPIAFEAGQEVTLTIGTSLDTFADTGTRTPGIIEVSDGGSITSWDNDNNTATRMSSTLNGTPEKLNFAWEPGDQILVTVTSSGIAKSSVFTLTGTTGTSTATFKGNMPAAGSTFSVQYPLNKFHESDFKYQNYVPNGIPKDKLLLSASGCTLGNDITLAAAQSVLRLNFYGTDITLDSIVVTNTSASTKYKLDGCASAGAIGATSEAATPFLIVVPASSGVSFTAKAFPHDSGSTVTPKTYHEEGSSYSGTGIPISGTGKTSFSTTGKTLAAGSVLNMASKEIKAASTVIWAPVNCGYEPANGDYKGYTYGKLYQWGRKVGGGYDTTYDASIQEYTEAIYPDGGCNKSPDDSKFYSQGNTYSLEDWYTDSRETQLDSWPRKPTDAGYVEGKIADPCPLGWRVPTVEELDLLFGGIDDYNYAQIGSNTHGSTSDIPGWYFDGTSKPTSSSNPVVFLPAAGMLICHTGPYYKRGIMTCYWSSSVNDQAVRAMYAYSGTAYVGSQTRNEGCSVRCVQEEDAIWESSSLEAFTIGSKQTW